MNALSSQERSRRAELFSELSQAVREIQELADGYGVRFASNAKLWMSVAEFVTLERMCCPFLFFSLSAEAENGAMWLRITGREGVKAFVAAELRLPDQSANQAG
jgi:hypothetical protein